MWRYLALFVALIGHPPMVHSRSVNPCRSEWWNKPVSEIVNASDTIYMEVPIAFVPDASRTGHAGYYLISSTGTELKGGAQSVRRIYGQEPFSYIPQHYFTVDQRHSEISEDAIGDGFTGTNENCALSPRFVIGYRYLIMLGTESTMSFEPIHDSKNDRWFKLIETAIYRR